MRAMFLMAVAALLVPVVLAAQDALPPNPSPNECYRFAFGPWSSPLDWNQAGHRDGAQSNTAPAERGDASRAGTDKLGDIVIYPPWWPVGVYIDLDTARASGDTVRGVATALVADGRAAVPTAKVIAFHVPCSAPPVQSESPVVTAARADSARAAAPHRAPTSKSRGRTKRTRKPSSSH